MDKLDYIVRVLKRAFPDISQLVDLEFQKEELEYKKRQQVNFVLESMRDDIERYTDNYKNSDFRFTKEYREEIEHLENQGEKLIKSIMEGKLLPW
jgi:hypothetical protein